MKSAGPAMQRAGQVAAQLVAGQAGLQAVEHGADGARQFMGGVGGGDAARPPQEQRLADEGFQRLDVQGRCRLGHAQAFGGPRER